MFGYFKYMSGLVDASYWKWIQIIMEFPGALETGRSLLAGLPMKIGLFQAVNYFVKKNG